MCRMFRSKQTGKTSTDAIGSAKTQVKPFRSRHDRALDHVAYMRMNVFVMMDLQEIKVGQIVNMTIAYAGYKLKLASVFKKINVVMNQLKPVDHALKMNIG